mgnify:CR=1 FL=1
MMKEFVESVKYMCSDENGKFQPIALVGSIAAALFIPTLWVFLYAIGFN